jgi:hypothetical protein
MYFLIKGKVFSPYFNLRYFFKLRVSVNKIKGTSPDVKTQYVVSAFAFTVFNCSEILYFCDCLIPACRSIKRKGNYYVLRIVSIRTFPVAPYMRF